ncbi:MAG: NAD+ synthase [Candidatus Bathyarchaeota archaeon]|nr:NAD+ synthase [Candidatus Bathyarchaeota archaeon]
MVTVNDLKINCIKTESKITDFISGNLENTGLKGAVIGLSGGIDSAVTLALTVKALGPDKVTAITMPERDVTPHSDIMDVMLHCEQLNLTCNTVEITPILHVMQQTLPLYDATNRIAAGNIRSRLRMIVLYHYANTNREMVMGTSNKTELLTGFFTKYGDGGVDLMPCGDLYKTQLRQLAKHLDIPDSIIKKPPSPGFYSGQTDEEELGIDYTTLDLILYSCDLGMTSNDIACDLDIDQNQVDSVLHRVKANEHKRRLPLILRLS